MRPPPPRPLFSLSDVAAMAIIVFCLGFLLYLLWPIRALVFQVYVLAAFLMAFRHCPPMTRCLARMAGVHRAVFFSLIGAVVIGHFTLSTRRYFPFVAWDIFSAVSEKDTVTCRELIGTTANGQSVRLLVEQLFPSIVQFDLPPTDSHAEMGRLVQAVAKVYNEHHADDPVRQINLLLMAVQLHPPARERRDQPSCELLQRFDISSAR